MYTDASICFSEEPCDEGWEQFSELIKEGKTLAEIVALMSPYDCLWAAINTRLSGMLEVLAEHPEALVRAAVARNQRCMTSLHRKLAHDPSPHVRIAILVSLALRGHGHFRAVMHMKDDPEPEIAQLAIWCMKHPLAWETV
jgi:hypothetical protein